MKNFLHNKNQSNFTNKKVYEYPGGNQVDGLPPVSCSIILSQNDIFFEKFEELKLLVRGIRYRSWVSYLDSKLADYLAPC